MNNATQTISGGNQCSTRNLKSEGHCPTLHPIPSPATLPEELWQEIFLQCLSADEFIRPSRTAAPLLLCQVCRSWRSSAISIPDLWASISIASTFDAQGCFPRVELVNVWLLRAKSCPLSISYGRWPHDFSGWPLQGKRAELFESFYPGREAVCSVFSILVRHIARWKSLRLCPKEIMKNSLPPIPQSGAPLLQSIYLFLPPSFRSRYDFSWADESLYDIWCNSPLLDSFTLTSDISIDQRVGSVCTSVYIRWGQLTTLVVAASLTGTKWLEYLKECPNLVDCSFHSVHIYLDNYDSDYVISTLYPTPILLTRLKSLSLRSSGPTGTDFVTSLLLTKTTMPALRQLTLQCTDALSPEAFAAFMHRSACYVEDLTLFGVDMNHTCFVQFLGLNSQTLVKLCIRHTAPGPMSDDVIHRFSRDESASSSANAVLCPKLESIDLDYRVITARDGLFSKMVSSRFGMEEYGITALKRVGLMFHDEDAMDRSLDVGDLKGLREEGVLGELSILKYMDNNSE